MTLERGLTPSQQDDMERVLTDGELLETWEKELPRVKTLFNMATTPDELIDVLKLANQKRQLAVNRVGFIKKTSRSELQLSRAARLNIYKHYWSDIKYGAGVTAMEWRDAGRKEIKAALRSPTPDEVEKGHFEPRVAISIESTKGPKSYTTEFMMDDMLAIISKDELRTLIGTSDYIPPKQQL